MISETAQLGMFEAVEQMSHLGVVVQREFTARARDQPIAIRIPRLDHYQQVCAHPLQTHLEVERRAINYLDHC